MAVQVDHARSSSGCLADALLRHHVRHAHASAELGDRRRVAHVRRDRTACDARSGTKEIEGYFLANRSLPWWAVGLSVMATQLSAVTMIGTTGQGATDGMRFVQFYFGLPLAMVILGVTLVPFLHGAKVYTAYEYLERRFDAKTRSLTAFLFLLSRGMSCGTIIAAPAVVFSAIFGWPVAWCVALIGVPAVLYTMVGGVQAVTWVDVKQMFLIVGALRRRRDHAARADSGVAGRGAAHRRRRRPPARLRLLVQPDEHVHVLVGAHRRHVPDAVVLRHGPEPGAALPRGEVGGRGADSLLISAYWKIPLQALVLLVGVLVFVFYQFQRRRCCSIRRTSGACEAQPAAYAR